MGIREQVSNDVKAAMKSKDTAKLSALRFLQAAFKNKEIEVRPNAITEDDVLSVLKKMVKQRKESIEQYSQAGRSDLAAQEQSELELLETYLPAQMGRDQVERIVNESVQKLGAKSLKEMGDVMKEVLAQTGGAADNKLVSELVKAKLQA